MPVREKTNMATTTWYNKVENAVDDHCKNTESQLHAHCKINKQQMLQEKFLQSVGGKVIWYIWETDKYFIAIVEDGEKYKLEGPDFNFWCHTKKLDCTLIRSTRRF